MSAYLAGLAILRCAEHERAAELDATARLVLAVMGSFAGSDDAPECYAARSTIAGRSRLDIRTLDRALDRLEKIGAVERIGRKGKTVRYRLSMLYPRAAYVADSHTSACVAESHTRAGSGNGGAAPHKKGGAAPHKKGGAAPHNPSDTSDPQGGREEDRSHPSADAPGSATSMAEAAPSKLIAQLMAIRGGSAEDNQRWADRERAEAREPIKSVPRFLVWKARDEVAVIESAAAKPQPTKTAPAKRVSAKRVSAKGSRPSAAPKRGSCRLDGRPYDLGTPEAAKGLCRQCYAELAPRQRPPACAACKRVNGPVDRAGRCASCAAAQ